MAELHESGGFPGDLAAAGKAAREQGRFAQGDEKGVGEAGFAGGARAGVRGDPADGGWWAAGAVCVCSVSS
ncbi:hypothetical protein Q3A86_36375 [Streptomyces sp. NBUA17]|uniref:hypothetical protein n=1 Tax=Streptomyces sp. NBUA17 TaxID=3062275 RepID=UPI0037DA0F68